MVSCFQASPSKPCIKVQHWWHQICNCTLSWVSWIQLTASTQISSTYVLARCSYDAYVSQVSSFRKDFGQKFVLYFFFTLPVASRSKAYFCGRLFAGIAGSNPAGGMDVVCCECCMLSGRGLCVGLITCPEESYRLRCVWVSMSATRCNNNTYTYNG